MATFALLVSWALLFVLVAATASQLTRQRLQTPSMAQKSFTTIKPGGRVGGPVAVARDAPRFQNGKPLHVSLARDLLAGEHALQRTSCQEAGTPFGMRQSRTIRSAMLYVDGYQLTLIHYCDAGNRPRMPVNMSPTSIRSFRVQGTSREHR